MTGNYQRKDHFYNQAKSEGYRSRASYKLIELDKKHRLLGRGMKVLDLGCFPGGWLQVALKKVGPTGRVVGIDLKEVDAVESGGNSAVIIMGDITETETIALLSTELGGLADVILSDLSPALSGIKFRDAARSAELSEMAFTAATSLLKPGGTVVAKIFPGHEADQLFTSQRKSFSRLTRVVLGSSRRSSSEFYLVGNGFFRS